MRTVRSKDGTAIAFGQAGDGPPLILVDGALCSREVGPSGSLASLVAGHFTVFTYDRRGRGDSGDTGPYAVEREVEDLQALVEEAGGSAYVYGVSSGAALALEAAARVTGVKKLALYEAPFIVDDSRPPIPEDYLPQLKELLAANRRGDAVRLFLRQVGLPAVVIALMRFLPVWSKLKSIAHTLPYDAAILDGTQAGEPLPGERWATATMPALAVVGGKSPAWFNHSMQAVAQALPNCRLRVLEGQTHMVKAKVHAPLLVEFFTAGDQRAAADRAASF